MASRNPDPAARRQEDIETYAKKCLHFCGVQHKQCRAGLPFPNPVASCCIPSFVDGQMANPHPCPKYEANGLERARQRYDEIDRFVVNIGAARKAITDETKGARRVQGSVPCPVCKRPGKSLVYSVAFNGHIHAKCMTPECVAWRE